MMHWHRGSWNNTPAKPPPKFIAEIAKRKYAIITAVVLIASIVVGYTMVDGTITAMATEAEERFEACNASLAAATASLDECLLRASGLEANLSACTSSLMQGNSALASCTAERDSHLAQLTSCRGNVSDLLSNLQSRQNDYNSIASRYAQSRCCQLKLLTTLNYDKYFIQNNNVECCFSQGEAANLTQVCTAIYVGQPLVTVAC